MSVPGYFNEFDILLALVWLLTGLTKPGNLLVLFDYDYNYY